MNSVLVVLVSLVASGADSNRVDEVVYRIDFGCLDGGAEGYVSVGDVSEDPRLMLIEYDRSMCATAEVGEAVRRCTRFLSHPDLRGGLGRRASRRCPGGVTGCRRRVSRGFRWLNWPSRA